MNKLITDLTDARLSLYSTDSVEYGLAQEEVMASLRGALESIKSMQDYFGDVTAVAKERDAALERDECNKKNIDTLVGSCENICKQRDAALERERVMGGKVDDVERWLATKNMSVRFDTPIRRLRDIARAVSKYFKEAP